MDMKLYQRPGHLRGMFNATLGLDMLSWRAKRGRGRGRSRSIFRPGSARQLCSSRQTLLSLSKTSLHISLSTTNQNLTGRVFLSLLNATERTNDGSRPPADDIGQSYSCDIARQRIRARREFATNDGGNHGKRRSQGSFGRGAA